MPAPEEITKAHWDLICERIHNRECVPFLGAAVNIKNAGKGYNEGLPLGKEVTLRLVGQMLGKPDVKSWEELAKVVTDERQLNEGGPYADLKRIELENLARVALHIHTSKDVPYLVRMVKEILDDDESKTKPSPLLQVLAELPFDLIVTTNYDRLMERALESLDPYIAVQPVEGLDAAQYKKLEIGLADHLAKNKGPILYKIHGSFDEEKDAVTLKVKDRSSIVISEEDYIRFLTLIGRQNEGIPNLIKQFLQDSTLLFLGYSLEDWDIRTIYKGLVETLVPSQRRTSFAIQWNPPDFWVNYWKKKGIEIYSMDLYKFAEELKVRYQTYVSAHPR
jgi:SIR2-like domain